MFVQNIYLNMNNLQHLCRICMCEGATVQIFDEFFESDESIQHKILDCFQIQVTLEDQLPKCICGDCYNKLMEAYQLKQMALKTEEELRSKLSKINNDLVDVKTNNDDLISSNNVLKIVDEIQKDLCKQIVTEGIVSYMSSGIKKELIQCNDIFIISNDKLYGAKGKRVKKVKKSGKKKGTKKKEKNDAKSDVVALNTKDFISNLHTHHALDEEQCGDTKCNQITGDGCDDVLTDCSRANPATNFQEKFNNLYCSFCDILFKHTHSFRRHMRNDHNFKGFDRAKDYMCDVCGNTFHDQYGLRMHKRSHTGDRPFTCNVCDQGFTQQSNMERHVLAKHQKVKPYQCEICSKHFAYSSSLRSHKEQHNGQPNYQCSICDRKFMRNYTLVRHQLTHTHARPYLCKYCDRSYTQSNDLKTHVKKIHPEQSTEKLTDYCIKQVMTIK